MFNNKHTFSTALDRETCRLSREFDRNKKRTAQSKFRQN